LHSLTSIIITITITYRLGSQADMLNQTNHLLCYFFFKSTQSALCRLYAWRTYVVVFGADHAWRNEHGP